MFTYKNRWIQDTS